MIRTHAAHVDDVVDAELGGAETNVRWARVARERRSGVAVPPVDVLKLEGDGR